MKILPFKIPKPNNDALIYQEDHEFIFYDKLHQHEEIQLSYIVAGSGTLIIGDSINTYKKGDILVIGSKLPHVFKSEISNKKSLMLSLFFTQDSFGKEFFKLEEMRAIQPFFKRSVYGFKISNANLGAHFFQLKKQNKLERFITLMQLLMVISASNYQTLSSFVYEKHYSDNEGQRMSAILEFTTNNYSKKIALSEIASKANMTTNAFCKYFKKRTNKTYFTFLNELRIEHACKLLLSNKELSILDIAELSGFNNISNFNRKFKKLKKSTPFEFRRSH